MIRITQVQKKYWVKDFNSKYDKKLHLEVHVVTTYWLLFIPVFQRKKLISSNM